MGERDAGVAASGFALRAGRFNLNLERTTESRESALRGEMENVRIHRTIEATMQTGGITVRMSYDGARVRVMTLDPEEQPLDWRHHRMTLDQEMEIIQYLRTIHGEKQVAEGGGQIC